MNAEVKKLWVEALRSGKYKQGKGSLRRVPSRSNDVDKFCCLGVLCDLHSKAFPDTGRQSQWSQWGQYDFVDAYLPNTVKKWACLTSDGGFPDEIQEAVRNDILSKYPSANQYMISSAEHGISLLGVNDATDVGFTGIADLIEKHL